MCLFKKVWSLWFCILILFCVNVCVVIVQNACNIEWYSYWTLTLRILKLLPPNNFALETILIIGFSPPTFYYYRHLLLLLLAGARNNFSLRARVSILIIIFIIINCFSLRKGTNWFFFLLSSGCFFFAQRGCGFFFVCNLQHFAVTWNFSHHNSGSFFFGQPSETKLNNSG